MNRFALCFLGIVLHAVLGGQLCGAEQADVVSPPISFQYLDSPTVTSPTANVVSPLVSFQFLDWPGDESFVFQSSQVVSYFFEGAPTIMQSPKTQVARTGGAFALSVQAQGSAPLSYQWRINGMAIPGAVAATFTRNNAQLVDSGVYTVIVANAHGYVVSDAARVFIYVPATTPEPSAPALTPAQGNPPETLTQAPRTPSSTQLKVFNEGGLVDRSKITIVMTHGWRSNADEWPARMKEALKTNGYAEVANILAWDWREDAFTKSPSTAAARTLNQGDALAAELFYVLGPLYDKPIHFIGHSLGTLLNCEAADYLHGDAKNSPVKLNGSSIKYRAANTHMTLFDEAELVLPIKGIHVVHHVLYEPLNDTTADLINNLGVKVIPDQYGWIDNYVSEVGLLHPEAANVMLWRKTYLNPAGPHGYAYEWYQDTIASPLNSAMGHRWSAERGSLSSAPASPCYYLQSCDLAESAFALTRISGELAGDLSAGRLVVYPGLKAYQLSALGNKVQGSVLEGVQYGGNVVANVAEQYIPLVAGPVFIGTGGATPPTLGTPATPTSFEAKWDVGFTLYGVEPPQAPISPRSSSADPPPTGPTSPPFVIIPVAVPTDAIGIAFEFQFTGATGDSYITMGIGQENYYAMEARFVEDGKWNQSTMIEMAEFAGEEIEIFFGLNGSESLGNLSVRGIHFYRSPTPTLSLTQFGRQMRLAWPLSGLDWTLEATTDLLQPDGWFAVPSEPLKLDYESSVTIDMASPSQFFRLRR